MAITSAKINIDQIPGVIKVRLSDGTTAFAIPDKSPAVFVSQKHTILQFKLHELQQADQYGNTHQVRMANGKKTARNSEGQITQFDSDIVGSGKTFIFEKKAPAKATAVEQPADSAPF